MAKNRLDSLSETFHIEYNDNPQLYWGNRGIWIHEGKMDSEDKHDVFIEAHQIQWVIEKLTEHLKSLEKKDA